MPHGGDIYRNKIISDHSVNLNPYGTPDEVLEAIRNGLAHLGEYPDPEQESVRTALAHADGVEPANIVAGNGASELITGVMRHVDPHRAVLPVPCFDGYRHALNALGACEVTEVPLSTGDDFTPDAGLAERMPPDTDLICLCDPWNPTGRNIDRTVLTGLLDYASARGISVLLDESFYHLSDKAVSPDGRDRDLRGLIARCPGLYIIRSYTKLYALPGLRMGYVISDERNIEGIRSKLPEWNISQPAAYAMEVCADLMRGTDYIERSHELIVRERAHLSEMLKSAGCTVYESDTVFVMIRSDVELYGPLLHRGILIRDLSDMPGAGPGYYRVAVRDRESNERLAAAIREIRQ